MARRAWPSRRGPPARVVRRDAEWEPGGARSAAIGTGILGDSIARREWAAVKSRRGPFEIILCF